MLGPNPRPGPDPDPGPQPPHVPDPGERPDVPAHEAPEDEPLVEDRGPRHKREPV